MEENRRVGEEEFEPYMGWIYQALSQFRYIDSMEGV